MKLRHWLTLAVACAMIAWAMWQLTSTCENPTPTLTHIPGECK